MAHGQGKSQGKLFFQGLGMSGNFEICEEILESGKSRGILKLQVNELTKTQRIKARA